MVGNNYLLIAGNELNMEPETTRLDGNQGLVYKIENNELQLIPSNEVGINFQTNIRKAIPIFVNEKKCILIAQNNGKLILLSF